MSKPEACILSCNMFSGNFLHLHLELICTGQVYWQEIQKTASWFNFSGKNLPVNCLTLFNAAGKTLNKILPENLRLVITWNGCRARKL
jgi:hypothetical protein